MKNVISISLGASSGDFGFSTTFLGEKMRVRRLGTDGSTARAIKLLGEWDARADAIGLGVVKDSRSLGARRFIERDSARMRRAVTRAPVTTGARLGDIFLEWAVRSAQAQLGHYFDNANVLFFSGTA
ncbi:MAG: dehydrogenase, partial [Caldimonas sp.]